MAQLTHARLDARGAGRVWVERVLGVLLDIPADVLLILLRQRQIDEGAGDLARAVAEPLQLDRVAVVLAGGLRQAQDRCRRKGHGRCPWRLEIRDLGLVIGD